LPPLSGEVLTVAAAVSECLHHMDQMCSEAAYLFVLAVHCHQICLADRNSPILSAGFEKICTKLD
jgi:hypothetical protein